MVPQLPQEVAETIIDCLVSKRNPLYLDSVLLRNLGSCALVCRAWVPRTRFHQFSTRCMHGPMNWEKIFKMPHYSQLLRTIDFFAYSPQDITSFFQVIHQFHALTYLQMGSLNVAEVPPFDGSSLPLRKIRFDDFGGKTLNAIWKFLCTFPHLEILDFNSLYVSQPGGDPIHGIASYPPLSHIGIYQDFESLSAPEYTLEEFIWSICRFPFARRLKALDVYVDWKNTNPSCLNELLRLCGSTLTRLSLWVFPLSQNFIDLSSSIALEILELVDKSDHAINPTLTSILPSRIRCIAYTRLGNWPERGSFVDWPAIDAHFSHSKFASLHRFTVTCDLEEEHNVIVSRLQNLDESGVLQFERETPWLWNYWSGHDEGLRPTGDM